MARIIGVASAKGGVGKTTLTIALGHALVDFGREVIAVDADFRRPQLGLLLGYEDTPKCVRTAMAGTDTIFNCTYVHPCGLRIIPASMGLHDQVDVQHFFDILRELHDRCEVIFVDTAPMIDPVNKQLFSGFDDLLLVTTPDDVSLRYTLETMHLAHDASVNVLGVVVNKVDEHPQHDVAHIEQYLRTSVIGTVQYGAEVLLAQQHKHPVTFTDVHCPASVGVKKLAGNLIGQTYVPDVVAEEKPWQDLLKRIGWKD